MATSRRQPPEPSGSDPSTVSSTAFSTGSPASFPTGSPARFTRAAWAGTAEVFAASFAFLCAGTVETVLTSVGVPCPATATASPATVAGVDGVRDRIRLLDVGTGTGAVAAAAVARGARVVAVEPDGQMRAHARIAAPAATVLAGGVPGLPFADGAFDATVANFVVNHVPDPPAAVRDLARVTRPGGRVAVTVWPEHRGVLDDLWSGVVGAQWPPPTDLPPELDVERSPEGMAGLLARAGLDAVEARLVEYPVRVDPDRFWLGADGGLASIGRAIAGRPAGERARLKRVYDGLVAPLLDGGELVLPTIAVLATGHRR